MKTIKIFKSEVQNIICEELKSKGYILQEKENNYLDIQTIFKITHPDKYLNNQIVVFYENTVASGREGNTMGINFKTGETFNFGYGNDKEIYEIIINKLKNGIRKSFI